MRFLYFLFEHETKPGFDKDFHPGDYNHEQHIGHDKVHVHFEHLGRIHGGHVHDKQYYVNFKVGDNYSHHKHEPLQHLKILHHVHNKVHEFITHHKPKALHFEPSDENKKHRSKKRSVYGQAFQHMAHVHNGIYDHDTKTGFHSIHFPHHGDD